MELKRLKTGITDTSYGVYPRALALDRIAAHGYDNVDFQGFVDIEKPSFKSDMPEFVAWLTREREEFAARGLTVGQAHAPWRWPAKDADPEEREIWLTAMKKSIYGAHVLGCNRFIVHPLMPYSDTCKGKDEVIEMNLDFFSELADAAEEYGVTVCMENLPFPDYPLASVEAVCDFVDRVNKDSLKVCLDTGHAAIFNRDVGSAVRYIGDRLGAVHIHDNMGDADSHLIPGDGIIDWDAFASALKDVGFIGTVSLETSAKHRLHPESEWEMREIALAGIALDIAKKAHSGQ